MSELREILDLKAVLKRVLEAVKGGIDKVAKGDFSEVKVKAKQLVTTGSIDVPEWKRTVKDDQGNVENVISIVETENGIGLRVKDGKNNVLGRVEIELDGAVNVTAPEFTFKKDADNPSSFFSDGKHTRVANEKASVDLSDTGSVDIHCSDTFDCKSADVMSIASEKSVAVTSSGSAVNLTSAGETNIESGGGMTLTSGQEINATASSSMNLKGSNINLTAPGSGRIAAAAKSIKLVGNADDSECGFTMGGQSNANGTKKGLFVLHPDTHNDDASAYVLETDLFEQLYQLKKESETAEAADVIVEAGDNDQANGEALEDAIKSCPEGGVVLLSEGEYGVTTTQICIDKSITIRGVSADGVVITSRSSGVDVYSGFCVEADNVTIENITIQPFLGQTINETPAEDDDEYYTEIAPAIEIAANNCVVKNCVFTYGSVGKQYTPSIVIDSGCSGICINDCRFEVPYTESSISPTKDHTYEYYHDPSCTIEASNVSAPDIDLLFYHNTTLSGQVISFNFDFGSCEGFRGYGNSPLLSGGWDGIEYRSCN